jgi:hypothetical protein
MEQSDKDALKLVKLSFPQTNVCQLSQLHQPRPGLVTWNMEVESPLMMATVVNGILKTDLQHCEEYSTPE